MLAEKKKCAWCEEEKEMTDFYSRNKKSKTLGEYIYYNPECKECTKSNYNTWRKNPENKESILASKRKTNQRPKHKETLKKAQQERKENGYFKSYYNDNKAKFKEYRINHENKKHEITDQEWNRCKEYFKHTCSYCGLSEDEAKEAYGHVLHMEHAINNGTNGIENCIPACRKCNSEKWTRNFDEWYGIDNPAYSIDRFNKITKWLKEEYLNNNQTK